MNKNGILATLRSIKPKLAADFGVERIALFGSYSRDEQTPDSDIDLLVEHHTPLGFKFLDLVYELDSLFGQEVQVVSKKGIKKQYFEAIRQDLIYA